LQREVEAYKSSTKLEIDSDEKHHSTVYPALSQLSKKYLCMCATYKLYIRETVQHIWENCYFIQSIIKTKQSEYIGFSCTESANMMISIIVTFTHTDYY